MARERKVYPTSEIAHLWAHQSKPEARNPHGNFYFEGDTIYSYGRHFPIARHIEHNGKKAILFVDHGYSNTTAKHIGEVRGSIPRNVPVFEVGDVRDNVKLAYDAKLKDVKERAEKLARCNPANKYDYKVKTTKGKITLTFREYGVDETRELDTIQGKHLAMHESGNVHYRGGKLYSLSILSGENAGISIESHMNRAEARIALDVLDRVPIKVWDVSTNEKRAYALKKLNKAREIAKKYGDVTHNPATLTKLYREYEEKLADLNKFAEFFDFKTVIHDAALSYLGRIAEEYEAGASVRREARREAAREKREKEWADSKLKFEEKLPRWLAGENVNLGWNYGFSAASDTDYLRVEKNEVATSRGARVPLEHVRKALPFVLAYVNHGREFKPNGHTIRLGFYTVSGIDADGTLTAGCHKFSKAEILRFAGVLSSLKGSDPSPSDSGPVTPDSFPSAGQEQTI